MIEIRITVSVELADSAIKALSQLMGSCTAKNESPLNGLKAVETEAPKKEQTAEPEEVKPEEVKALTTADIRQAMAGARIRIEGEDYESNADSKGREQWHRPLTGWFKQLATQLGAAKPSAISDQKAMANFIAACADVHIENGELSETLPF